LSERRLTVKGSPVTLHKMLNKKIRRNRGEKKERAGKRSKEVGREGKTVGHGTNLRAQRQETAIEGSTLTRIRGGLLDVGRRPAGPEAGRNQNSEVSSSEG